MRRVSSGRVVDTSRAFERFRTFVAWSAAEDGELELEGATVGNSPDGSPFGEVNAPLGSGGSAPDGIVLVGRGGSGDAGGGVLAATTLIVAAEWKESALLPRTVAVSVIRSPAEAALRTKEPATSSSLWPAGNVPTVQTSPLGFAHTVNRGASTCATLPRATVTVTP
jgi:hypothetical protein